PASCAKANSGMSSPKTPSTSAVSSRNEPIDRRDIRLRDLRRGWGTGERRAMNCAAKLGRGSLLQHQHGTLGVVHDALRRRAEEELGGAGAAMGGEHDEVRIDVA